MLKTGLLTYRATRWITTQPIRDTYKLAPVSLNALPKLTNFKAAKDYFAEKVLAGNKELDRNYVGPPEVVDAFRRIFPEIVESRDVKKLPEDASEHRDGTEGRDNKVFIELDSDNIRTEAHIDMLCIGGPSTITGALLCKLRHPAANVMHVTRRYDSNHDGSAYCFRERDGFPVYVNKVNRGPYCIYIDLKKRLMGWSKVLHSAIHDRNHVKISLKWSKIKLSMLWNILIPNVWHMIMDLYIRNPRNTLMRHTVDHAKRTHDIIDAVVKKTGLKREAMMLQGFKKSCYVGFGGNPEEYFRWLNNYSHIPFSIVDHKKAFGRAVKQVVAFPRDGLFNPWMFENLASLLLNLGVNLKRNFRVEKLLVHKSGVNGIKVTKVVWKDTITQERHVFSVDRLILSLGPSASFLVRVPPYPLWGHFLDLIRKISRETYQPSMKSLGLHILNKIKAPFVQKGQILNEFMPAAGSTNVIMVGVEKLKVSEAKLEVFTKCLDGLNQHWTIIAERDVEVNSKWYRFFAIQMTGGWNFPSRKIRPDCLVNLLYTTEHTFGLHDIVDVMYDCVQTIGCARAVSAKNSVAFSVLADNAVVAYTQGATGMTTMFPDGELMLQLLESSEGQGTGNYAEGLIGDEKLQRQLYDRKNVLEGIDLAHLIEEPGQAAKRFGWML